MGEIEILGELSLQPPQCTTQSLDSKGMDSLSLSLLHLFFPPSGSSGDGKFPCTRTGARCKLHMRCRYLQCWETHDVGHACGASPPRRGYRMSAAAGGAECLCCSSSYVSSGWIIKNIARYHSYFMGHLPNELSAWSGLCQPVCTRV